MPTMPLAKQILALWIMLPPVFIGCFLLAIFAPFLVRADATASAAVKPSRDGIAKSAKDRDLAHGMGSGHAKNV